MKARIKFQKYGAMKFIGHLDVMRYFQKVFRRAEIDNEYTKGFSPHQIMSFAAPLGVGLTSDGEYVDVQLLSSDTPEVMMKRINEVLTEGFHVIGFHPLLEREENTKAVTAMAQVASADYLVSLKDGYQIGKTISSMKEFKEAFEKFFAQENIVIGKKTKKSEKDVDIKPMISLIAFDEKEYRNKLSETVKNTVNETLSTLASEHAADIQSVADVYDNGIKLYMKLDTGSSANLKPELVMEAFCEYYDIPYEKFAWQVHRIEVYSKDESGKLIPLDCLER